jgi:hypothetical protein
MTELGWSRSSFDFAQDFGTRLRLPRKRRNFGFARDKFAAAPPKSRFLALKAGASE